MNGTSQSIRAIIAQLNSTLILLSQSVISRKQRQQQLALTPKPLTASEQLLFSESKQDNV